MRSDSPRLGAILLAAGASTRLGQPKQLLQWRGQTLLRNATSVALESGFSPVVVVLGSRADDMRTELQNLRVETVINPEWANGMGASLQYGMRHLESSDLNGVMVLLCDQPLVTSDYLRALIESSDIDRRLAVASQYEEGIYGPPCLFSKELFPVLLASTGARGARAVLGKLPPEQLSLFPFPEGRMDVDTPQDWERVRKEAND